VTDNSATILHHRMIAVQFIPRSPQAATVAGYPPFDLIIVGRCSRPTPILVATCDDGFPPQSPGANSIRRTTVENTTRTSTRGSRWIPKSLLATTRRRSIMRPVASYQWAACRPKRRQRTDSPAKVFVKKNDMNSNHFLQEMLTSPAVDSIVAQAVVLLDTSPQRSDLTLLLRLSQRLVQIPQDIVNVF
jgi:hypothetical protein